MASQFISIDALRDLHQARPVALLDVRTRPEFNRLHAAGARVMPLDELDPAALMADRTTENGPLYVLCQSGARAAKACDRLAAAGFDQAVCVMGGTIAWEQAGLPVVRGASSVIAMERQVRIAAGLLVLLGIMLAFLVHPAFVLISGFVGAGLAFSGITNTCGMARVLMKMPWNK